MNVDVPRSVAYVALEAPGSTGDWTMRGSITQGDVSSWILAGSYVRHAQSASRLRGRRVHAMQQYLGGNGEALAAMRDTSRNVGCAVCVRLVDDRAERARGLWRQVRALRLPRRSRFVESAREHRHQAVASVTA